MVDFELWERVAGWRECGDLAVYGPCAIHLCVGCLEARLGRTLTGGDFIACPLNTDLDCPRSPTPTRTDAHAMTVRRPPPTDVAKAALTEAGRPDLAERVYTTPLGWPAIQDTTTEENPVIAQAFWLAHISTGHSATLKPYASGATYISCEDCGEPWMAAP